MLTLNIQPYSLKRMLNVIHQTKNKVVFRYYNLATKVEQKKIRFFFYLVPVVRFIVLFQRSKI